MYDRRGIANITDALLFIIIITVVASLLIPFGNDAEVHEDIEEVHDLLLATELKIDRFIPGSYGTMSLYKLLILSHSDDEIHGAVKAMCEDLLDSLTPKGYHVSWTVESGEEQHLIGVETDNVHITSVRDISDDGGIITSKLTLSLL